jgi:hypothetical protein
VTWRQAPIASAFCLLAVADARADHGKIDHVALDNANQVTCEVLELKRGKLSSGRFLFGPIDPPQDGRLIVHMSPGDESVDLRDVVRLVPIEAGFWNRVDGSIDFGFSFAQADSLTGAESKLS